MPKVAVVTDSCASIPESIVEALGIRWVPYYIHMAGQTLRDLVTAKRDSFYQALLTIKRLPTTASPGPGDYVQTYQELAEEGAKEIVSIHMTSKGSGAFQAAKVAQSMVEETIPGLRVAVIDTLNVAMCQGWMAIEAARASLDGKSLDDIVALIERLIPITHMIQTADTLKYLYMGGRIGRAKQLVGSLLSIKPLIGMEEGVIVPLGTARSRRKAYEFMADTLQAAVGETGRVKIAYMHAAAADEVEKLRRLVEERVRVVETIVAELSPALGVHSGPGTAGLCYYPLPVEPEGTLP
jgi:DegV family protein with EDD domain